MLIDLLITVLDLQLIDEGKATHYNPGIMDDVVQNRLKWKQITQEQVDSAVGFVATQTDEWIGRQVILDFGHGLVAGPFLVVDCGQKGHQAWLDRINFAVDLQWEWAWFLRTVGMPLKNVKVYLVGHD